MMASIGVVMDRSRSAVKPVMGVPTALDGHLARETADRKDRLNDVCGWSFFCACLNTEVDRRGR